VVHVFHLKIRQMCGRWLVTDPEQYLVVCDAQPLLHAVVLPRFRQVDDQADLAYMQDPTLIGMRSGRSILHGMLQSYKASSQSELTSFPSDRSFVTSICGVKRRSSGITSLYLAPSGTWCTRPH
jgi:hypothetical protein